jgi:predicted transcriptional regulator
MATTIHIPRPLLDALDKKARAMRVSRNRLIVRAIEQELTHSSEWSPGFFERLAPVDEATGATMDGLLGDIRKARRSKPPPAL